MANNSSISAMERLLQRTKNETHVKYLSHTFLTDLANRDVVIDAFKSDAPVNVMWAMMHNPA